MKAYVFTEDDIRYLRSKYFVDDIGFVRNQKTDMPVVYEADKGYLVARVKLPFGYKTLCAHRVVYALAIGVIPVGQEIDHIDRNRKNNVPSNLRLVTRSENMHRAIKKSSHGLPKGVAYAAHTNKRNPYLAQSTLNGTHHHLGYFNTPELAKEAYDAFCHQNFRHND